MMQLKNTETNDEWREVIAKDRARKFHKVKKYNHEP